MTKLLKVLGRPRPLYMTTTSLARHRNGNRKDRNVIASIRKLLNNLFRKPSPVLNQKGIENLIANLRWIMIQAEECIYTAPRAQDAERVSHVVIRLISGNVTLQFQYADEKGFCPTHLSINARGVIFMKNGSDYEAIPTSHPAVQAIIPMFESFAHYVPFTEAHKQGVSNG